MREQNFSNRCPKHNANERRTDSAAEKSWKFDQAKRLVHNLKSCGPGGLIAVTALSALLNRVIKIWSPNGCMVHKIGYSSEKYDSINVEYQPSQSSEIGHWTRRGGREPRASDIDLNACLFVAVGSQIGRRAVGLRASTVRLLKKRLKVLAGEMDHIIELQKAGKLMLGGAKYRGHGPNDAKVILDNSQNVYCSGCSQPGHPRGHASCPRATGHFDSAENYSSEGMKSAFLSREDQDQVAHFTLLHQQTQSAMRNLNTGQNSVAVTLDAYGLGVPNLPKMKEFYNGNAYSDEQNIQRVTMVLRHHPDKVRDPDADVFVHTFYPRNR